jgi:hypothetical protein
MINQSVPRERPPGETRRPSGEQTEGKEQMRHVLMFVLLFSAAMLAATILQFIIDAIFG